MACLVSCYPILFLCGLLGVSILPESGHSAKQVWQAPGSFEAPAEGSEVRSLGFGFVALFLAPFQFLPAIRANILLIIEQQQRCILLEV
jgi:hypothetical protein